MRLIVLLLCATSLYGQQALLTAPPIEKPETCSTHTRNFWNGHWFSSNMCPVDYERWLEAHPPHPWYKDTPFWGGVGIIGGSIALDAASTSKGQQYGLIETNPILGAHPNNGQIAAFSLAGFGLNFGLHYLSYRYSHKDPSTAWRTIGRWQIPVINAALHIPPAVHNYQLIH